MTEPFEERGCEQKMTHGARAPWVTLGIVFS
jgi:hypothetical protein